MADPVSIALKGAGTAFTICKATYELVQAMKRAPDDIRRVAADMQGFYNVLGTLSHTIEDQRGILESQGPAAYHLGNISSLIEDAVGAFQDIQIRVQDFIAVNGKILGGRWERLKWHTFAKEDVTHIRLHLSNIKLSLSIALSTLTLVIVSQSSQRTSDTNANITNIRQDLQGLRAQLHVARQSRFCDVTEVPSRSRSSVASMASATSLTSVVIMEEAIQDFVASTERVVSAIQLRGGEQDVDRRYDLHPDHPMNNIAGSAKAAQEDVSSTHIDDVSLRWSEQWSQAEASKEVSSQSGMKCKRNARMDLPVATSSTSPAHDNDEAHDDGEAHAKYEALEETSVNMNNSKPLGEVLDLINEQLKIQPPAHAPRFPVGEAIDLSRQGLLVLPVEAISLMEATVRKLAISDNPHINIPTEILNLQRLTFLNLRWCNLDHIPDAVLRLSRLKILDIAMNRVVRVPEQIENMVCLQALYLSGNRISHLPLALVKMKSLEALTVYSNPVEFPPQSLLTSWESKAAAVMGQEKYGRYKFICQQVLRFLRMFAQQPGSYVALGSVAPAQSLESKEIQGASEYEDGNWI